VTKTDELLRKFRELNVWRRGDERAPHKPLLVLYALGRLQAGVPGRLIPFDELEEPLARLLVEFGPPRKSVHPELPFFHLQTDGVWEIENSAPLTIRRGSKNPLRSELRKFRIGGGFTESVYQVLKKRPEVIRELACRILSSHFPESLHKSIAGAVGLQLDGTTRASLRDSAFRSAVISAWGHQCAFCGFNVQLDNADLGLEAAHIRWCQFGGPDSIDNGLACCTIHHQALDRGAITVSDEHRILVSSRLHGGMRLDDLFLVLHGRSLLSPTRREALPKTTFLAWHRTQVFRGEARD
jgi:putative restriction endonuclease